MWGRSTAAILWIALAFVVWNVVFDRTVAVEGARFVRESIQREQGGEPPVTIADGYRPRVRRAALDASLWGGIVLVLGFVAVRRSSTSGAAPDGPSSR